MGESSRRSAAESGPLVPAWVTRVSRASWAFLGFVGAVAVLVLCLAALREIIIPLTLSEPKLMGSSLNLHPIAVLLATVAGGALMGIVGLIPAAPAVAIGRNLFHELQTSRFFGPPPEADADPPAE